MPEQRVGERYRLRKRLLVGEPTRGLPELWVAEDAGDVYFAKLWKRQVHDSGAIQALWNREVRSLSRLQGYPGAAELFVRLHDMGEDERNYFVILDGGRRTLLAPVLQNRSQYHWLVNLNEVGRRRPLWEGLLRIAEAIAVLHSEGTLHRSLSSASVFTGPDGAADFRLSGFEWSLRIASSDGAAAKVGHSYSVRAPELEAAEAEYSMATDWFDFGLLAAETFGVAVPRLKKREMVRSAVKQLVQLRDAERQAVLHFLAEEPEQRVSSAEAATEYLRNIVRELNVATTGIGRNLVLALRLSGERDISRTIDHVSGGQGPAGDPVRQREWVQQDLRGDIRVISRIAPYPHFVLKGEKLEYHVRQWDVEGLRTWDLGYCESLESRPRTTVDDQVYSLGQRKLDIILYPDARRSRQRLRDRAASWDRIFAFRRSRAQIASHLRDVHDFFRVTQQLETVLLAAQVCPVSVLSVERTSSETEVILTPREEVQRNALAQALRLSRPSEQLRDWFGLGAEEVIVDDEDDPKRDDYQLLERRIITSDAGAAATWRFMGARASSTGPQYRFRTEAALPIRPGNLYLARDYDGSIAQIRRRYKAIEDMRTHEDLLRLLSDPRGASRQTGEHLPAERVRIPLDASKVSALEKLWKTQPSFAIQGPPGTGKTTLIKAFADRLLARDPTAQILITAHSHHTVDDVLQKLDKQFRAMPQGERPILIRIGSRVSTSHDVAGATSEMLRRLCASPFMATAPKELKLRIEAAMEGAADQDEAASADFRTLQLLVQDAANITFTTSNAADLEDLNKRGRRFDWSIIEEAGKAHGFDMAAALQASHRLLLIGDHFQLPPFNARLFKELLGDPLRVRKAVQIGAQFAPTLVDPAVVDDADDRESFEERCTKWRQMVEFFAVLFENSRGDQNDQFAPAATLTDQHRMHPDIASVVGRIFYPDGSGGTILMSPEETQARFASHPPFDLAEESWLPVERIVWYDVPWVQKKEWSTGESDGLFSAPNEAAAVVSVLEQLRPRAGYDCEIQILSPYNDQLSLIKREIELAKQRGQIPAMFMPPFDLMLEKRLGATVDEFQGSEADIVIVSLVRNNGLVPWKSVGFLKEANRMNVLLSRARHKLIIVGSWDFFESRCNENTPPEEEYAYIGQMMRVMSGARRAGQLAVVGREK